MKHKAYRFDWALFDASLHPVLHHALESDSVASLHSYIDANLNDLTDPYEGQSLDRDWRLLIEHINDVHEIGDFALTRFYDALAESGIGGAWLDLSESLPTQFRTAMLGRTVGPPENPFDPGRMGSYFQSADQVIQSVNVLFGTSDQHLMGYMSLLNECRVRQQGLYVTF